MLSKHVIKVIKKLYGGTKITIKTSVNISETISVHQGVLQGCSLSPTMCNIYIDALVRRWKRHIPIRGFHTAAPKKPLLFADNQFIIEENENELHRAVYKLGMISKEYHMEIAISRTKLNSFESTEPFRLKIVFNNRTIQQAKSFSYLGNEITYGYDIDIDIKVSRGYVA